MCYECKEEYLPFFDPDIYKLLWKFHELRNREWTGEEWELFIMFLQGVRREEEEGQSEATQ